MECSWVCRLIVLPIVRDHDACSHGCYSLPFVSHRPSSLCKFKEEHPCGSCGLLFLRGNSEDEGLVGQIISHPRCNYFGGCNGYSSSPSYNIHSEFLKSLIITLVGLDGLPNSVTQVFIPGGLEHWSSSPFLTGAAAGVFSQPHWGKGVSGSTSENPLAFIWIPPCFRCVKLALPLPAM